MIERKITEDHLIGLTPIHGLKFAGAMTSNIWVRVLVAYLAMSLPFTLRGIVTLFKGVH